MNKKIFFIFSVMLLFIFFSKDSIGSSFSNISSGSVKKQAQRDYQELLGIKIESLRLTAYGKLIDLRYRILDKKKALIIFSPKIHPYLVDVETNKKLHIPNTPKIGSLRSFGSAIEGRVYFMLFNNTVPLKKGAKVNLVIGDVIIEDLVIK
jgi:hypothetical protein